MPIHPLDADVEDLTPQDYQIREVMLGKPTLNTARLMVTIGIKEVFRSLEQEGIELIMLHRQNEILKGYLAKVVGPLDPEHLEETLKEGIHLDPFLKACQQW